MNAARRGLTAGALLVALAGCGGITLGDIKTDRFLPSGSCLVIGFLGGRDHWDDETKGVRQLALSLRDPSALRFVETFENQRRDVADDFVRDVLARSGDVRLVLYGQSFGGAAVTKFARSLFEYDIEVALTVQVDSVGRGDGTIPANVRAALNLYQDNGAVIRGESPIRAEDPSGTEILGNWRYDYDGAPGRDISLEGVSVWKRMFRVAHAKMDRDERVWSAVSGVIEAACAGDDLSAAAIRLAPP